MQPWHKMKKIIGRKLIRVKNAIKENIDGDHLHHLVGINPPQTSWNQLTSIFN